MYPSAEEAESRLKLLLTHPIDSRGRAYFVERPEGRRLIVTDIHGCFQTFVKLMEKVELRRQDQLFILGDMINRGPYSLMVLQYIWQLLCDGYQVLPLRGNHEQMLLDYNRKNWAMVNLFAERQNVGHLLKSNVAVIPAVDHFLGELPFYFETDDAFLVHAGFDMTEKDPLTAWKKMIWVREFRYNARKLKSKQVIHGHVPIEYDEMKHDLHIAARNLCLDNGCVRAEYPGFGRLVCLDLDSGELTSQKNADTVPWKVDQE